MISAIVLAAGQSKRMGQSKLVLPWGNTTVIGKVIETLLEGGIRKIYVVAGSNLQELKVALQGYQISYVYNPQYANGEMITSVKKGLQAVDEKSEAILIVLGDQPQVSVDIIHKLRDSYINRNGRIIVPRYHRHRGHPLLVDKSLWNGIKDLEPHMNLRDYLDQNDEYIFYLNVDTPDILQDLDTPEDYKHTHP